MQARLEGPMTNLPNVRRASASCHKEEDRIQSLNCAGSAGLSDRAPLRPDTPAHASATGQGPSRRYPLEPECVSGSWCRQETELSVPSAYAARMEGTAMKR